MGAKASYSANFLLFIAFWAGFSKGNITYTLVSPKLIQPFSTVRAALFISRISDWSNFSASIIHKNGTVCYTSNVVETNETHPPQLLKIPTEDLPEASYTLVFNANCESKNISYKDQTTVFTVSKQRSILIQTDKTTYQPGEIVKLRVLILNRNLKLLSVEPTADIFVYDSEKHLIKRWINVTISKGLVSCKVRLSNLTNLGEWKISVKSAAREETQAFSVIKNNLPKFKLDLKLQPQFVTFNSSIFTAKIKADYNFGRPISEKCVVTLKYYYPFDMGNVINERAIVKTVPINGVAYVEFDIRKELEIIKDQGDKDFQVTAVVVEEMGGLFEDDSEIITMYKYPYKLDILTERESYTPGFPLKITVKVTTQDGTPITDSNPQAIKVTHGFSYYAEGSVLYSPIPSSGLVDFTFNTPTNEYLTISNIDVTYKELTQWFPPPKKAVSNSWTYLHLTLSTPKPTAGNDVVVTVQSNKKFPRLLYLLVSRGRILLFDKILLENSTNNYDLTISLPTTANPTAVLLVGSILPPNDSFVINSLKFPVAPKIENYVNIVTSDASLEPGNNVTLQIETSPSSLVALRAVDQSVMQFNDMDITMDKLQLELLSYEDEIMRRKDWSTLPAYETFEDAGLIILTNFHVVKTRLNSVRFMLNEAPMALARLANEAKNYRSGDTENAKLFRKAPETWFFEEISTESGNASFVARVPDTLTSWVITGFSLSDNVSIGVTKTATPFKTYRLFFISAVVPHSVKEGEIMALQILVHNFMDMDIATEITLDNSDFKYDFIYTLFKGSPQVTKTVHVRAQGVSFVQFMVKYHTKGVTELKVKAVVPGVAGDTLTKLVHVKPNGIVQRKTTSFFVSTSATDPVLEHIFNTTFPEGRQLGMDKLSVSVIGDILQLTAARIDPLISDYEFGEQSLFSFGLNVVVLQYLEITGQLTPNMKEKLVGFLELGYQRELTFRRYDGSFSAFGNEDLTGSAWLSACALRSFLAAKPYITIDCVIIEESLAYLSQIQKENGSFVEEGDGTFSDGLSNDAVITGYITLVIMETLKSDLLEKIQKIDYQSVVQKALTYLSSVSLTDKHNAHTINLIAYCLELSNHSQKDVFFEKMESLAIKNGDEMFWKIQLDNTTDSTDTDDNTNYSPKPHEIETAAYAMLIYIHKGMVKEAMPIFKWMVKQMNCYGGFLSNQDTITSLRALSKMTTILKNDDPNVDIVLQYNADGREEFKVQQDNAQILQERELPNTVSSISIKASGTGTALVQLTTSYFIAAELQDPTLNITINVTDVENLGKVMGLFVCGKYTGPDESNMILMEITLPTGYAFNSYSLKDLKSIPKLMHYETGEDNMLLTMYFSFLRANESVCVHLNVNIQYMVINHAPGRVVLFDYYDISKKTIQMYRAPVGDICKICNAEHLCKVDDCE